MENKLNVCCPDCNHKFDIEIEEILSANVEKKFTQDFDAKLKLAEEKIKKAAANEIEKKDEQLKELKKIQLDKIQLEKQMKDLKEQAELDIATAVEAKLQEREVEIKAAAEKMATDKATLILNEKERELKNKEEGMELQVAQKSQEAANKARQEEQMKIAELQKQLDVQKGLAEEMKRKAEQGSMQLQGEVQELALEELLRITFPSDVITEVKKGANGADCIQTIRNNMGQECGKLIFESKRTKVFNHEWIGKLKTDQMNSKSDIAIIVTEVLPKELSGFGFLDGVWICTYAEVKSLTMILRDSLMRVYASTSFQENKGEKMQMMYDYLTGNEFFQKVSAIVEGFTSMQNQLLTEKKVAINSWAKREKEIMKVLENTVHLYGSVRGIAGGAVREIKELELNDKLFLD